MKIEHTVPEFVPSPRDHKEIIGGLIVAEFLYMSVFPAVHCILGVTILQIERLCFQMQTKPTGKPELIRSYCTVNKDFISII